jgi:hypothetical protein
MNLSDKSEQERQAILAAEWAVAIFALGFIAMALMSGVEPP